MRIRILLGAMPRMLHDVVDTIVGGEPDLLVVADGVEADELAERVEREQPAVVILSAPVDAPPVGCEELLGRFPRLAVVAMEDQGQHVSIYMTRPMRVRLAEISRLRLVTAIRRAAAPVPFPASVYDVGAHVADTTVSRGNARG